MGFELDKNQLDEIQNLDLGVLDSLEAQQSKHEIWLQKHEVLFTSSEDHRLIAGVDETKEQASNRIANKMLKGELENTALELQLATTGTKADIAMRMVEAGHVPYGANVLSEGGETFVLEKVIGELTDTEPDHFENRAMRWGKEWEETAVKEFMRRTGIKVDHYGENQIFVDQESEYLNPSLPKTIIPHIGCTPDGLIGDDAGIETKCPDSKQHILYMQEIKDAETLKETYPEAYWQCQGTMYRTGRSAWFFVSFDPRFKQEKLRMLIVKVKRNDDDIEKLERRLKIAVTKKIEQVSIYNS